MTLGVRDTEGIKSTKMAPDFCSPVLYKIRQGAAEGATLLIVLSAATQNTGKKTSQMVYFIFSGSLMFINARQNRSTR